MRIIRGGREGWREGGSLVAGEEGWWTVEDNDDVF